MGSRSGVKYCHSPGKEKTFPVGSLSSDISVSPRWQKVKQVMAWMKCIFYDYLSSPRAKWGVHWVQVS